MFYTGIQRASTVVDIPVYLTIYCERMALGSVGLMEDLVRRVWDLVVRRSWNAIRLFRRRHIYTNRYRDHGALKGLGYLFSYRSSSTRLTVKKIPPSCVQVHQVAGSKLGLW